MTGNFVDNTLMVGRQLHWVTTGEYCRLSGETREAVDGKRKNGLWIEGLHWKVALDNRIRLNLLEIDRWIQFDGISPGRLQKPQGYRRAIPKPVTA
jgi:hypothetical protein